MPARRSLVPLIGLLFTISCSPDGPPVEISAHGWPIINGTFDNKPEHNAVVAIYFQQGQYGGMCSGTMITPVVVLTAGHCVPVAPSNYYVIFGTSVQSQTYRRVSDIWRHPRYDENNIRNDIALMRLTTQAPSNVTPIPHLPHSMGITQSDVTNRTMLDFVGFGMTDPNNNNSSGTKMMFTDHLDYVCSNEYGCSWPNPATSKDICQDQNPSGLCSGDSGGPAIVRRNGQMYVAGVASYVGQGCAQFGCNTKVDEYEQDINNFIGGVLGASCARDSDCDSGHCQDGVCCESLCTGECYSCNVPGQAGRCVAVPDGTSCDKDGNICNGQDTCQAGSCTPGEPLQCSDGGPCKTGSCDPVKGCIYTPVPNGTSCANLYFCDGVETCQDGVCTAGTPPDCDDGNPCTEDTCSDEAGRCLHQPVADGTSCGGGKCGDMQCMGGECVPVGEDPCDDGNPCTEESCDPEEGCKYINVPDGLSCGPCMVCEQQQCLPVKDCGTTGGCGCATDGPESAWWAGLLALYGTWMARRRRRR